MNEGLPEIPDRGKVRGKQLAAVAVIAAVAIGVVAYSYLTNPQHQMQQAAQTSAASNFTTPSAAVDPQREWIARSELALESMRKENQTVRSALTEMRAELAESRRDQDRLRDQLNEANARPANLPPLPLPPPPAPRASQPPQTLQVATAGTQAPTRTGGSAGSSPLDRVGPLLRSTPGEAKIAKVTFDRAARGLHHIRDTIPAGSFGRAVLLSGLDAPTGGLAQKNPHPVLLELQDDGNLPNNFRHKVRLCRIIAAGYGNISDERAYLRLERLSCVLRNGDIVSQPIKGYATGEDGKNGLRGRMITKQGSLIARAFISGAFAGMGQAVAQSYSTLTQTANGVVQSFDPNRTLESGIALGFSTTAEKIADWYLERANETYPIIEIDAGRVPDLVLTEDVQLGANLLAEHAR